MWTVVRFLALMILICIGEARQCYNCTGDCVRYSECKGSCFTSVRELGGDELRSCIEDTEETHCIPEEKSGVMYKTCYCNTELCNPASTPIHLDISLFLVICVPLLLRMR